MIAQPLVPVRYRSQAEHDRVLALMVTGVSRNDAIQQMKSERIK